MDVVLENNNLVNSYSNGNNSVSAYPASSQDSKKLVTQEENKSIENSVKKDNVSISDLKVAVASANKLQNDNVKSSNKVDASDRQKEKQDQKKQINIDDSGNQNVKVEMDGKLIEFKLLKDKNVKTGEVETNLIVYLLDKESGKVIRRLPPEDYTDLYKKDYAPKGGFIDKTTGVFLDQKI